MSKYYFNPTKFFIERNKENIFNKYKIKSSGYTSYIENVDENDEERVEELFERFGVAYDKDSE